MRTFTEKVAIVISSGLIVGAAGILLMATIYLTSNAYEVISSDSSAAAFGVFALILVPALILVGLAALAFCAIQKRTKGFQIGFACAAVCLIAFLTYFGMLIFALNGFMVEMINDPNGEADPGLLPVLIPGFDASEYEIKREVRVGIQSINALMCSAACTCNVAYRNKYKGVEYSGATFLPSNPLQANEFYPTCFNRKPAGFPDLDPNQAKMLHVVEELYHCSGLKEKLMYYVTLDIKEGEPEKSCGDVFTQDQQGTIKATAVIMTIVAIYIFILLVFQCLVCMGCEKNIRRGRGDDDNYHRHEDEH